MGFDAVWISPVVQNIDCGYHGYWGKNLSAIEDHFGGPTGLKNFMGAAKKNGIAVMLDIVGNHMGPSSDSTFNEFFPFNSNDHYHGTVSQHCQAGSATDQSNREDCWLVNLCDLKQENQYVTQQLVLWMQNLQKNYDFDGIRIDTVPYVPKQFWKALKTQALPDTYTVGEVLIGGEPLSYTAGYQYSQDEGVNGPLLDATLNYPLFWTLRNVFQQGKDLNNLLETWNQIQSTFHNPGVLGNFAENHDQPRWLLGNNDKTTYQNALTATFFLPGVPIAYYGTEQGMAGTGDDNGKRQPLWSNGGYNQQSDLFLWTTRLVLARKAMLSTLSSSNFDTVTNTKVYNNGDVMSFQRGNAVVVVSHALTSPQQVTVTTGLGGGKKVCDYLGSNASAPRRAVGDCQPNSNRNNCDKVSYPNQTECVNAGCCWAPVNPNPSNLPWCFYPSNNPPPPPPPPGGKYCVTTASDGSITVSMTGLPRVFM